MAVSPTFQKETTMKKAFYLMLASVVTVMAGFLSCGDKGNTIYGPDGSKQTMTMTGTYRISGDSIYVAVTYPADTNRYCNGANLVVHIDTAYTQPESGIPYVISNSTLTLTATDPYMNGAGYTIAMVMTLTRVGPGTGMQGTWNFVSETYSVLSGTAPDSIKRDLDALNAEISQRIASGEFAGQYIFSGNQFSSVSSYAFNWADDFVSSWTDCNPNYYSTDTCTYAVTVVKLSSSSVRLLGKTSGETVTVTWNAAGDETYTSSDSTHHAGTYYVNPASCPNTIPAWYNTFLSDNPKPALLKKSVQQIIPKKPPHAKWPGMF
jgi:hypothetical protein